MDETVVEELRDALPRALVIPIVDLAVIAPNPKRMARDAALWELAPDLVSELLNKAVAPLRENILETINRAGTDLDAGRPDQAADQLLDDAVPKLKRLDALLPRDQHRSTARLLERAAILLNNAAFDLAGPPPRRSATELTRMYVTALGLVAAPAQRATIRRNLDLLKTTASGGPAGVGLPLVYRPRIPLGCVLWTALGILWLATTVGGTPGVVVSVVVMALMIWWAVRNQGDGRR